MTKEITKAIILQQIQDKFKLRDFEPAKFLFDETVVPTYEITPHVKNWEIDRGRVQVTGNGALNLGLNPSPAEKWEVRRLTLIHETGANFDIDQFFTYGLDVPTNVNYFFYDTTTPITSGTVKIFELPQDIILRHRDRFYINVSNFVVGGYVALHVLVEVETIR